MISYVFPDSFRSDGGIGLMAGPAGVVHLEGRGFRSEGGQLRTKDHPRRPGARAFEVSGIYALAAPFHAGTWGPWIAGETAAIDATNARFEVEVPAGEERTVAAIFRDRAIAEQRWHEGDGEVVFRLDV